MTFAEVFDGAELGAVFAVSNGKPQPSAGGIRLAIWQSHNFTGPLLQKLDRDARGVRGLVIEAVNAPGLKIAYTVLEGPAHTF